MFRTVEFYRGSVSVAHCATAFNFPAWCSHNSPSNIMLFPLISSAVRLNICVDLSNLHLYRRSYYGTCGGFISFTLLYEILESHVSHSGVCEVVQWRSVASMNTHHHETTSDSSGTTEVCAYVLAVPTGDLKHMSEIALRSTKSRPVYINP